jgi:predicted amidohydrolase
MKYKIGVLQFEPKLLEIENNLKKMAELLADVEADLIVLPELAASGYLFTCLEEVDQVAEDAQTGRTATTFKKLAMENNTSFVVGFAEKDKGKFYNSSMLVNPDGKIFIYRKTHLFYEENNWFEPGNSGLNVFEAKNGVRVGLMICFDWIFPEAARTLALRGTQIITHSANLVLPWCQQAMITRSLENRVFSITSNRTGTEKNREKELTFTGMSQILSTKGEILARCETVGDCIKIVEIDPAKADVKQITEFNHAITDRRPEMYEN